MSNEFSSNQSQPLHASVELDPINRRSDNIGYPDLANVLLDQSRSNVTQLIEQCKSILEYDGAKTVILATPARVSKSYFEMTAKELDPTVDIDKTYYVRVATNTTKKGVPVDEPFFVFDETPEVTIITPTKYAMFFKSNGDNSGGNLLVSNGELDFNINDPRYIAFASRIINNIGEQVSPIVASKMQKGIDITKFKELFSKSVNFFSLSKLEAGRYSNREIDNHKEKIANRRLIAGMVMGVTVLCGGHIPFGGDIDAKIGPVPMPAPIEFIVDLANMPDHDAQGFDQPDSAQVVEVGGQKVEVPLVSDYDTEGAPDATYSDINGTNFTEESRPGLYEVDFVYSSSKELDENSESEDGYNYGSEQVTSTDNCIEINGNYTEGRTSVLTQNAEVSQNTSIKVIDQDTAELCLVDVTDSELAGSIFVYQNNK